MISINYQTFGTGNFKLRLRLYQDGDTKFLNVTKYLKGDIKPRHWNQRKQQFTAGCPFSDENNAFINQYRRKYDDAAREWEGSLQAFLFNVERQPAPIDTVFFSQYFEDHMLGLMANKHHDGTMRGSYETYEKCRRRVKEYCDFRGLKYEKILLSDVTPAFVTDVFLWLKEYRANKGKDYVSKALHAIIAKADKDEYLDLRSYRKCDWHKKKRTTMQKFYTLTEEQCTKLATMDLSEVATTRHNELYRDFCLFSLCTGQSPCDTLTLKYSDIKIIDGVSHFVFIRRKLVDKQSIPCAVPISAEMQAIMDRWRRHSKEGYIFPIRSTRHMSEHTYNNLDIKKFVYRLNCWLKKVGKALGCQFPLHTYTFRHTAITRYISKGIPVIYVANMMGTSVENCEKIYYNNQGDVTTRNKVMSAMKLI